MALPNHLPPAACCLQMEKQLEKQPMVEEMGPQQTVLQQLWGLLLLLLLRRFRTRVVWRTTLT